MNTNTLGLLLGLVVLGIAFTGGAAATQDSTQNTAVLGDAVSATDAPTTLSEPTATPTNSLEAAPLAGCCCCEWRFKPSLDRLSSLRTDAEPKPTESLETTAFTGCCCCEWRFKPSLNRLSDLRADAR
ncbi:hypothetical protein [Halorussus salinus]|uniref:hypothetical protein n=1 Tax=Halorussus salinus TaxID=1364935 RepID=UPI001092139D|nr:hypothetical protein [Halorussus salinus]